MTASRRSPFRAIQEDCGPYRVNRHNGGASNATGRFPGTPPISGFAEFDGRGNVNLVSDPRNNGLAVVRIEDPKGGREGYTFDLEWSGGSFGNDGRFGNEGRPRNDRGGRDNDFGNRVDRGEALRACRDAITQRIGRDGYSRVNVLSAEPDNNPGRNDYIFGRATARSRSSVVDFDFTCHMNFDNGRVRSVELNRR